MFAVRGDDARLAWCPSTIGRPYRAPARKPRLPRPSAPTLLEIVAKWQNHEIQGVAGNNPAGRPVNQGIAGIQPVAADSRKPTFESLVLPELDAAYNFARWMTGNPTDAQDVVQDAMVRMLRFIDGYRGGSPRAWVLSVVRNTAMSWLKANRRPGQVSLDGDAQGAPGPGELLAAHGEDGGDPAAIELRRSQADALRRAIGGLPLEQREVVLLRDIEGLSYRDIATVLGIPPGTVMSRLARARDVLEECLRGQREAQHDA